VTSDSFANNKLFTLTGYVTLYKVFVVVSLILYLIHRINPDTGDGGVNMIAVPKDQSSLLARFGRADFMEPIDVAGERFYIQDYNISICMEGSGCVYLNHVKESNSMCGGGVVPEEAINFWQSLSNSSDCNVDDKMA
jgi:hypothetical protein